MTNPYVEEAKLLADQYGYTMPLADQPAAFLRSVYGAMPPEEALALSVINAFQDQAGQWQERPEQRWFTTGSGLEPALKWATARNRIVVPMQEGLKEPNSVFWNCASRKPEVAKSPTKRGNGNQLLHVTSLWSDIDCAINNYSLATVMTAILGIALRPTWIVFSGGGLQCIWVLNEAIDVSTAKLGEKHKNNIMALTQPLISELEIEVDPSVIEVARMLRVPGFVNRKYERKGAIAHVIFHDPECVYNPAQIQEYIREHEGKTEPKVQPQPSKSMERKKQGASFDYGCLDKGAETLVKKWLAKLESATVGTRHDTLTSALCPIMRIVAANRADYATIDSLFKSTARQIGLEYEEVEKVFQWAWDVAQASPLDTKPFAGTEERIDLDATPLNIEPGDETPPISYGMSVPPLDRQIVIAMTHEGALGMATLLRLILEGRVCYDHADNAFYYWMGHVFAKDRTRLMSDAVLYVQAQLRHYARLLSAEVDQEVMEASVKVEKAVGDDQKKTAEEALDRAQASANAKSHHVKAMRHLIHRINEREGVRSILGFLSEMPTVALSGDEWDKHPYLLAVHNGILDLKDGTLRNGRPDDLLRTASPTAWEGVDAPCPRFQQFLNEVFEGNQELIDFVRRLLGYGLCGEVREHVMIIMSGQGRNGKDTLLETLYAVLGEFASVVSNDVFVRQTETNAGRPTPHLMSLRSKRIVWASESGENAYLNAAQVKLVSGGGSIRARPLHGNEVTFPATHLPILLTNYCPRLPGYDYALKERVLIIPFNVSFVDEPALSNERKAEKGLSRILRKEAPGILAWLVQGCLEYQRIGLKPPVSVRTATKQYMDAQNPIIQFIKDCCLVTPGEHVPAGEMWKAYRWWCLEQRRPTGQQVTFKAGIKSCGYEHVRGVGGARFYEGIMLMPDILDAMAQAAENQRNRGMQNMFDKLD